MDQPSPDNVIVFDGVCNLCNRAVSFIIERDAARIFRFSSMQSETGAGLLSANGIDPGNVETFLLIRRGTPYIRSDAAIEIAKELDRPWRWFTIISVIPKSIRDRMYSWIAANRYRWFGKRSECMTPTSEQRSRFI